MLEAEIMPPEPRGRPPAGPQTLAEVAQEQKNKLAKPYNNNERVWNVSTGGDLG